MAELSPTEVYEPVSHKSRAMAWAWRAVMSCVGFLVQIFSQIMRGTLSQVLTFVGLRHPLLSNPGSPAFKPLSSNDALTNTPPPPVTTTETFGKLTVAILGAVGEIGQPLALLIRLSPLVSDLHLYDIASMKGVAADINHCNTPSQVFDFTGPSELGNDLKGVDVVVIPAGAPRKSGMARDDLFNINANIVKALVEAVADNCLDTFIHIISNPVNSTVLIVTEVLKQKGVYDPKKLFGVTTLNVVRANTFIAQKKNLKLINLDVPVVGGHAGITILPLLSKARPYVSFTDDEVEHLTVRIQNAGTEVVEAKAGAGSMTLSMAYAAVRFVESSLRVLDGDGDVYECSFIQSDLTEFLLFASRIKLGKKGVEALIPADFQGLTEYEAKALEALKPELNASIEKGVAFA